LKYSFPIISFFPHAGFDAADIAEYNAKTHWEYGRIRDFLVLHYKATARDDSEFWSYCRTMPIPDSLRQKMEFFPSNGRIQHDGLQHTHMVTTAPGRRGG